MVIPTVHVLKHDRIDVSFLTVSGGGKLGQNDLDKISAK